jgi:hypothetical protein
MVEYRIGTLEDLDPCVCYTRKEMQLVCNNGKYYMDTNNKIIKTHINIYLDNYWCAHVLQTHL